MDDQSLECSASSKLDIQKSHLTFCYCFATIELDKGYTEQKCKFIVSNVNKPLFQAILCGDEKNYDSMGKPF